MLPAEKVFHEFLHQTIPAWSQTVGYPAWSKNHGDVLGPGILGIPLDEAPANCLNGLYLDRSESPRDLGALITVLDKLLPGGGAVLNLDSSRWKKKDLLEICKGSDMIARFPKVPRELSSGLTVLLERRPAPNPDKSKHQLSVIIPVLDEDHERIEKGLRSWINFLGGTFRAQGDVGATQIIIVHDGVLPGEEHRELEKGYSGDVRVFHHYRGFGPGCAVRTGLTHAAGRKVLVDESAGTVPPEETLALLAPWMQEQARVGLKRAAEKSGGVSPAGPPRGEPGAVIGFESDILTKFMYAENLEGLKSGRWARRQRRRGRARMSRLLGTSAPESTFRLYSAGAARAIAREARENGIELRLESLHVLKAAGIRVETTPVERNGPMRQPVKMLYDYSRRKP